MGSGASLGILETKNSFPLPGIEPSFIQPVAWSLYWLHCPTLYLCAMIYCMIYCNVAL